MPACSRSAAITPHAARVRGARAATAAALSTPMNTVPAACQRPPITSGSQTVASWPRAAAAVEAGQLSPTGRFAWFGLRLLAGTRRIGTSAIADALDVVGLTDRARDSVSSLSGGQQQLIRQAQAFAQNPELLLCDEPLLSLDPARARNTVQRLAEHPAAVVCVTHSINPVMGVVDRVLYLGPEGHVVGSVSEVMRSEVLSELYGTRVDVVEVDGRMVVL